LDSIEELKISHQEAHKLSWENYQRSKEVMQLQQALGDFQVAVFEERKHTLKIVAENDALKIQELKDRKKIRFLLSLSGSPEEEITYFRDRLDKRLVKIARSELDAEADTPEKKIEREEQDIIILEDEVEGLKLELSSMEAQLEEQKEAFDNTVNGLIKERNIKQEEEIARRNFYEDQTKALLEKLSRMRTLCRENTRGTID
jgi:coiled-coil domain-containing protein 77